MVVDGLSLSRPLCGFAASLAGKGDSTAMVAPSRRLPMIGCNVAEGPAIGMEEGRNLPPLGSSCRADPVRDSAWMLTS